MDNQLDYIKQLHQEKEKLLIQLLENKRHNDVVLDRPLQSEQTEKLSEALAKAQVEFPRIEPNRQNSFNQSKYADLEAILWMIRPILGKNGISLTKKIYTTKENTHWLIVRIEHFGQWQESRTRLIQETSTKSSGYQEFGKALSYMARYAVMSLLGVRSTKDELDDDDQINASKKEKDYYTIPANRRQPEEKPINQETITPHELTELEFEIGDDLDYAMRIKKKFDIDELADLPAVHYRSVITRLREIKREEKGIK